LARLLGEAAALNLIAGRVDDNKQTVFDVGYEVIEEGRDGLPLHLIVVDHRGTFQDYESDLIGFAKAYGKPVNDRVASVPRPRRFAQTYIAGLRQRFLDVQAEYALRPNAFKLLFEDLIRGPRGSFKGRWDGILERMEMTNVDELCREIRKHITVSDRPGEG
jgi:hypothetical protein